MQELLKILNIYNIKNKLFDIVTNNASNNNTSQKNLKRRLINVKLYKIKHKIRFLI
jgi:hypothetical protein